MLVQDLQANITYSCMLLRRIHNRNGFIQLTSNKVTGDQIFSNKLSNILIGKSSISHPNDFRNINRYGPGYGGDQGGTEAGVGHFGRVLIRQSPICSNTTSNTKTPSQFFLSHPNCKDVQCHKCGTGFLTTQEVKREVISHPQPARQSQKRAACRTPAYFHSASFLIPILDWMMFTEDIAISCVLQPILDKVSSRHVHGKKISRFRKGQKILILHSQEYGQQHEGPADGKAKPPKCRTV